jgi:hypothetical protein
LIYIYMCVCENLAEHGGNRAQRAPAQKQDEEYVLPLGRGRVCCVLLLLLALVQGCTEPVFPRRSMLARRCMYVCMYVCILSQWVRFHTSVH